MTNKIVISFIVGLVLSVTQAFGLSVNITKENGFIDVEHGGESVRIQRIQNTKNRLTNSYTKTSRPCPPFCIHPISVAKDVTAYAELEVLEFLEDKVKESMGLLIDARMPQWYRNGTIPGALNIPFTLLKSKDNPYLNQILNLLGAQKINGKWDFKNAQDLVMFDNGAWCDQSPRAIKSLLKVGYPAKKLFYYRGGIQSWQLLGLTTVVPK